MTAACANLVCTIGSTIIAEYEPGKERRPAAYSRFGLHVDQIPRRSSEIVSNVLPRACTYVSKTAKRTTTTTTMISLSQRRVDASGEQSAIFYGILLRPRRATVSLARSTVTEASKFVMAFTRPPGAFYKTYEGNLNFSNVSSGAGGPTGDTVATTLPGDRVILHYCVILRVTGCATPVFRYFFYKHCILQLCLAKKGHLGHLVRYVCEICESSNASSTFNTPECSNVSIVTSFPQLSTHTSSNPFSRDILIRRSERRTDTICAARQRIKKCIPASPGVREGLLSGSSRL